MLESYSFSIEEVLRFVGKKARDAGFKGIILYFDEVSKAREFLDSVSPSSPSYDERIISELLSIINRVADENKDPRILYPVYSSLDHISETTSQRPVLSTFLLPLSESNVLTLFTEEMKRLFSERPKMRGTYERNLDDMMCALEACGGHPRSLGLFFKNLRKNSQISDFEYTSLIKQISMAQQFSRPTFEQLRSALFKEMLKSSDITEGVAHSVFWGF